MSIYTLPEFDPSFAAPSEWAQYYRQCGMQIVPAHMPKPGGDWKIPLVKWKTFQRELVPEATFTRWYGPGGEHVSRRNLGIVTGQCSGNIGVIDLDTYKSNRAGEWWAGLMAVHNNGFDLETVEQITGGGGQQKLYRFPQGWLIPTNRTKLDVDIRGQGGFAMLAPSIHENGRAYEWKEGFAPWECEITAAPDWLCDAILELVAKFGGQPGTRGNTDTPSPDYDHDSFGNLVDGRETYMRDMVWANVVDWRVECPIKPPADEIDARLTDLFSVYERKVKSRVGGSGDNASRLDQEGRGYSALREKFFRALAHWDDKVAAAAKERPVTLLNTTPLPATPDSVQRPAGAKLLLSAAEFVAGFRPPEYLVDGVIQRSYLYSLTARTGHGKTAVALHLMQCIARGEPFHGKMVEQGSVLFLVGENPDDVRARFLVMADHYGFDSKKIPVSFLDGVVNLAERMPQIHAEAERIQPALVIVDTAAAYFIGDDGNSNVQQGAFARLLRQLTFMPSKPCVVVPCHPVKNAAKDNLLPVGGGAFLNEVDGNLTLWSSVDRQTTLHWQGKFRGPEFDPMTFEIKTIESDKVIDSAGRLMPSVVAAPLSELAVERAESSAESDENVVLRIMHQQPRASVRLIAEKMGKSKSAVSRLQQTLQDQRLISKHRRGFRLTAAGREEIGAE